VTVTATIHDAAHATVTSISYGKQTHVRVSVTAHVGTPTGSVTIRLYASNNCTTQADSSDPIPLSGGVTDSTAFSHVLNPGSWSYRASYLGDATYATGTSDCLALTVTKANPEIGVGVHDANHAAFVLGELGPTLHPVGFVSSNGGSTPTGTLTFERHADKFCGSALETSAAIALSSGQVHATSFTFHPVLPGTVAFKVSYSGDTKYNSGTGCVTAQLIKVSPNVTARFTLPGGTSVTEVVAGQTFVESMTVEAEPGVAPPTGAAKISVYANSTCSGTPTLEMSAPIESGGPSNTTDGTPAVISMRASYDGDARYNGGPSSCRSFTIKEAETGIITTIHGPGHVDLSAVPFGTAIHVHAKFVQGKSDTLVPTGTATVTFSTGNGCRGDDITFPDLALQPDTNAGLSTIDVATASVVRAPGEHSFRVDYDGDSNFNDAVGECVQYTVLEQGATPPPTPTPGPGATPGASTVATSAPSAGTSPDASAAPGASVAGSPAPGSSIEPAASAGPTVDPGVSVPAGASPRPSGPPAPGDPAGTGGDGGGLAIAAIVVALVVAAAVGYLVIRRRRATTTA
jgi:hypothetical protein